ncbi:putative transcription factor interactor and regulator CCHC(Zn) family [Helianthus anomalus]
MPMSMKAAKEHLALLASFVASYENYIQGKISDPATFDEDYDQEVRGKDVGFDKTKVRRFNCQSYGHFARECQRPKTDSSSQSSSNRNASNNSGSKALISTAREGSYDWSVHLEADENVTQAFMAEIVQVDDVEAKDEDDEAKVDGKVEKITEAEVVTDDQTTEVEEEKLKSDDEQDAEEKDDAYRKKVADLVALMANLDKQTGEVSSKSACLRCRELVRLTGC